MIDFTAFSPRASNLLSSAAAKKFAIELNFNTFLLWLIVKKSKRLKIFHSKGKNKILHGWYITLLIYFPHFTINNNQYVSKLYLYTYLIAIWTYKSCLKLKGVRIFYQKNDFKICLWRLTCRIGLFGTRPTQPSGRDVTTCGVNCNIIFLC